MRIILLLATLFALCLINADARIYKCIDENGNTVYMDTPISDQCTESKEVPKEDLPSLIETKSPNIPANSGSTTSAKKENKGVDDYESLIITSPINNESLRSNEGQVLIAYTATPSLRSRNSHRYVVLLGSAEVYRGTNTSISLENVDRGTHSVSVKIVAANGRTLANSEPIAFTLQRYSRLQNKSRVIKPTPLPN